MPVVRRGLLTVLLATLLVAGALEPAVASDRQPAIRSGSTAENVASQAATPDSLVAVQEFHLTPDRPGEVTVELRYTIPDRVVRLNTTVPEDARVVETDGFEQRDGRNYVWNDSADQPSITYRYAVNESVDVRGPEAAEGRYLYADTGDWALFARPRVPTSWSYRGSEPLTHDLRLRTDGPGATGEWLVFLGEHEEYEREAHDQRFRLVVPDDADLRPDREDVLDSLADASDALRVGDRDDEVFVVAVPTGRVDWGVRGAQTGDADIWVRDAQPLAEPDNVWLHEYVHTRQRFRPTRETLWLNEGTATYYGAMLSLEQELVTFQEFADMLTNGERPVHDEVVLSNLSTWGEHSNYNRGALVAGRLDHAIRTATDQERTLQDVVRRINARDARLSQVAFLSILGETGGSEVMDRGQRYTEEAASVSMWNGSVHRQSFGELPARVGYGLPDPGDDEGFYTAGPYRRTAVGGQEPIRLVTGEEFVVRARVNNSGGVGGEFSVPLTVNGTVVARDNGTVEAGGSTTARLNHTFATPGRYEVGVDGDTVTVVVERPATARVTDLTVTSTDVRQGEQVTAVATVRNNASIPGRADVVFTRDYRAVEERTVTLPPNGTEEVRVEIPLPDAGTVTIGAGTAEPIELSVESVHGGGFENGTPVTGTEGTPAGGATTERSPGGATAEDGPGFGVLTVLATVLALAVAALARRR